MDETVEAYISSVRHEIGDLAIEVVGEWDADFSELPIWVLVEPHVPAQQVYNRFFRASEAFRAENPNVKCSIAIYCVAGAELVTLEVVDWDQLSEDWVTQRLGPEMDRGPLRDGAIFSTIRNQLAGSE